ncbi:hypothetical protein HOLleu_44588 [Holothuria leucospilota]|uniref:Uncharacterized protein n=1 Tax=Holothuria leucospilota TaxID=206669 RepID=A0A9Q0YFN8_HOLLE|nr:hypothetical protein HOLleu_44588 [Holothuria leucospilota]
MKKRVFKGQPHLCLFALREIHSQEELRYDYGQPDLPWRTKPAESQSTEKPASLKRKGSVSTGSI